MKTREELLEIAKKPDGLLSLDLMLHCLMGKEHLYAIYKPMWRGWYRTGGAGYTDRLDSPETWLLPKEEAEKHTLYADAKPEDSRYAERVVLHLAPVIRYTSDLNALAEARNGLTNEQQEAYGQHLYDFPDIGLHKESGEAMCMTYWMGYRFANAAAWEHTIALILTLQKP